jgi:hypothetical protein
VGASDFAIIGTLTPTSRSAGTTRSSSAVQRQLPDPRRRGQRRVQQHRSFTDQGQCAQDKNFLSPALDDPSAREPSVYSSRWIEDGLCSSGCRTSRSSMISRSRR